MNRGSSMNKTTVLIVEDEEVIATDLAAKLDLMGYEVIGTAMAGEKAIEMACGLNPGVVLMDIELKGKIYGIEAAHEMRRQINVPVIFVSAHSDSATLERAKATGPFGYILKPYDERDLFTTI